MQALRIPGTSLTQSVEMQQQLERALIAKFPEVERVFARTGTAEIASDPMPPNISDTYVMLKPAGRSGPSRARPRDELLARGAGELARHAGQQLRVLAADPDALQRADLRRAQRRRREGLRRRHGRAERDRPRRSPAVLETGARRGRGRRSSRPRACRCSPSNIDREKAARYGLNVADVQDVVATAVGGREAGHAVRGRPALRHRGAPARAAARRSGGDRAAADCRCRRARRRRARPASCRSARWRRSSSRRARTRSAARTASAAWSSRANVRGRDLGSFVAEAEQAHRRPR